MSVEVSYDSDDASNEQIILNTKLDEVSLADRLAAATEFDIEEQTSDDTLNKLEDHNSNSEIYREEGSGDVFHSYTTSHTVTYTTQELDDSDDDNNETVKDQVQHRIVGENVEEDVFQQDFVRKDIDGDNADAQMKDITGGAEDEVVAAPRKTSSDSRKERKSSSDAERERKASRDARADRKSSRDSQKSSQDEPDSRRKTSQTGHSVRKVSARKGSASDKDNSAAPVKTKTAAARDRFEHSTKDTHTTKTHHVEPAKRGTAASAKARFEKAATEKTTTTEKRASFSKAKAHTTAGSEETTPRRISLSKTRTGSVDHTLRTSPESKKRATSVTYPPSRKTSSPDRRGRIDSGRKRSSTDEEHSKLTPAQIRARFEMKSGDTAGAQRTRIRPHVVPGSAAAARNRFEKQASGDADGRRRAPSGSGSADHADGAGYSAAKMRARFEQVGTADSGPAKFKKPTTTASSRARASSAAKKFNAPSTSNNCTYCSKTVYPMEKLEADGKVFHKFCFKCEECKNTLRLGNYAALQGKIYCKPHFKRLFRLKGNYDEGFGRQQRKTDWIGEPGEKVSSNPDAAAVANGDHHVSNGDGGQEDSAPIEAAE